MLQFLLIMLNEKYILKIALIISILGLVGLLSISGKVEPENITDIERYIEKTIKIKGKVLKTENHDSVSFLTISREVPIDVILFHDQNITIEKDSIVQIEGDVKDDNGEINIIGHQIELMN